MSLSQAPFPSISPRGPRTTGEFVELAQKKVRRNYLYAALLALGLGGIYAGMSLDTPIIPIVLLLTIALPIVLWYFPRAILYLTFGFVCLIEIGPTGMPDALTDRVPVFWNLNTIVQTFAHANLKAVPFSLFECILILAGICSLFRAVFTHRTRLRVGPLFLPILGYLFFVFVGLLVGLSTGGDFKIALQEIRPQVYIGLVYLMAVNLVTDRQQVERFLWMTAICLAFKAFLYTFRQYVTLHGLPLPDQGVGSHEEAFLFDGFFLLLMTIALSGTHPKLRRFMLATLPIVVLGYLSTNRRAGTAALIVLLPVFFLAAYQALPQRRRFIVGVGIAFVLLFAPYYQAFKNSDSSFALPARSLKSQFQPDARDASSNAYRDAENADQYATIKSAPLGFGYGKHFIHAVPIADISNIYLWWDLIPHNQILWVWMRTGLEGFVAFWIMVSAWVIYCGQIFRDESLALDLRMLGLFAIMIIGCLLIFGLLDLQLSNPRDVIFCAFWIGVVARLRTLNTTDGRSASGAKIEAASSAIPAAMEAQRT